MLALHVLGWFDPLVQALDSVGIKAGKRKITLWSVLKILFTVGAFILVAVWIARWFERRLMAMQGLALSMRIGIAKFSQAFLIGLSILLGLNAAGLDLTTLNVLTGAIGIGLGFGLQAIAANFVSGFVLLMDRSIKPGDVISFTGTTGTSTEGFGWVQELRGRYVVVRDRDGVETLVPNQHLITNPVINWSYTDPRVRLKLPVRVSYKDDPEQALAVLLKAAEGPAAHPARSGAGVAHDGLQRLRLRSGAALLDLRSAGRREQRALRREPRDLAAVQGERHHDPGRAARGRPCEMQRPRARSRATCDRGRHAGPDHPRRGASSCASSAPADRAARTSTRSRARCSCAAT